MELKLTAPMLASIHHIVNGASPKGRSEVRNQARLLRAIKAHLPEGKNAFEDGAVEIDEDRQRYLRELIDKALNKGDYPGLFVVGLDDFLEVFDEARESEKKDAK